jgi:hypothetical protein
MLQLRRKWRKNRGHGDLLVSWVCIDSDHDYGDDILLNMMNESEDKSYNSHKLDDKSDNHKVMTKETIKVMIKVKIRSSDRSEDNSLLMIIVY